MLPHTARQGDLVEVIQEDHEYFGLIGKIVNKDSEKVTVEFYGKQIHLLPTSLSIRARVGTSRYESLHEVIAARETKHLTWRDLNDLMNHALDVGEYEWAFDLKQRRDGK